MAERRRGSKGDGKRRCLARCWDCFPAAFFSPALVTAHPVPTFCLFPHPMLPQGCWSGELMLHICRPCSSRLSREQSLRGVHELRGDL